MLFSIRQYLGKQIRCHAEELFAVRAQLFKANNIVS